jgi:hypothetical protein
LEYWTVSKGFFFADGQIFKNHRNASKFFFGMTTGQMGWQLGSTSYEVKRQLSSHLPGLLEFLWFLDIWPSVKNKNFCWRSNIPKTIQTQVKVF